MSPPGQFENTPNDTRDTKPLLYTLRFAVAHPTLYTTVAPKCSNTTCHRY